MSCAVGDLRVLLCPVQIILRLIMPSLVNMVFQFTKHGAAHLGYCQKWNIGRLRTPTDIRNCTSCMIWYLKEEILCICRMRRTTSFDIFSHLSVSRKDVDGCTSVNTRTSGEQTGVLRGRQGGPLVKPNAGKR